MNLLILAGTYEARVIIESLPSFHNSKIIVSYRETPRITFTRDDVRIKVGGFGNDVGFRRFLHDERITMVLDATHPFAQKISARTARICRALKIEHMHILRPAWRSVKGDKWLSVPTIEKSRAQTPSNAVVFFAAGRQNLEKFGDIGAKIYCRQLSPPLSPFPYKGGAFLYSKTASFSLVQEIELFQNLGISHIICKNSGGIASYTKIEAARLCALTVIMIERPTITDIQNIVETPKEAIEWIKKRMQ